ncbi:MAG: hypothetical protein ACQER7_09525 [Bacteroidota bacterium]
MVKNSISIVIPDEVSREAKNNAQDLRRKLAPYLVELSNENKKEMLKLGDKSLAFVTKARDWARSNPKLVPPYGDLDEFNRDFEAYKKLKEFVKLLKPLVNDLEDTIMKLGNEIYKESLVYYGYMEGAADAEVEDAREAYMDLKERFPGRGSKAEPEEEAEA